MFEMKLNTSKNIWTRQKEIEKMKNGWAKKIKEWNLCLIYAKLMSHSVMSMSSLCLTYVKLICHKVV